jgi:hypothetical protein
MPTPTRTTIKDAIVTAIKADTSIASTRVTKGRYNVPDGASFPQVFVWMMREATDTQTITRSRTELRTMDVDVDYWAKATTSGALEDAFDVAADAIKAAMEFRNRFKHLHELDMIFESIEKVVVQLGVGE